MSAKDVAGFLDDFDEAPVGASASDFLLPSSDDELVTVKQPTVACHNSGKKTKKKKTRKPAKKSSSSSSSDSDSSSFDPIAELNADLNRLRLGSQQASVKSISSEIASGSVNTTYRKLPMMLRLSQTTQLE
jgi:hypothetical protein